MSQKGPYFIHLWKEGARILEVDAAVYKRKMRKSMICISKCKRKVKGILMISQKAKKLELYPLAMRPSS